MKMRKNHFARLRQLFAVVAASLLLVSCGGGGGGESAVNSTGTGGGTPAPVPAPVSDSSALNPGLSGKLWFKLEEGAKYYTADANTGLETFLRSRETSTQFYRPAPDGVQYLAHSYDTGSGTTTVKVYNKASTTVQTGFTLSGWVTDYRFSPDGRYIGLLLSDTFENSRVSTTNPNVNRSVYIVDISDLNNPKEVPGLGDGEGDAFVSAFGWLPDNRYIYLRLKDRALIVGSPKVAGGAEQVVGTITVPAGKALSSALEVHPDGTQLAVVFNWVEDALPKSDIWVTTLQGGNPERVSSSGIATLVAWSPDGNYLAVRQDTGSACVAGGCFAHCTMQYMPRAARNYSEAQASPIRVYESSTVTPETLSCRREVFWTR